MGYEYRNVTEQCPMHGIPMKDVDKFKAKNKYKSYGLQKTNFIRTLYISASIVWLIIILFIHSWESSFFGIIILSIPFIVFGLGYYFADRLTIEVEDETFRLNYFSIGLIVVIPLFQWATKNYSGDMRRYVTIIILALVLSMLTLIDVWIPKKYFSFMRHFKSMLQTMSLTLFIYAIFLFYSQRIHDPLVIE